MLPDGITTDWTSVEKSVPAIAAILLNGMLVAGVSEATPKT